MSYEETILKYQTFLSSIPLQELTDSTIFITGGTGLVGSAFIHLLLAAEYQYSLGLKIYALVRSEEKANSMFAQSSALTLVKGDISKLPPLDFPIDYIVHAASPTSSQYFVDHPVETINTAVCGTMNMLELAREKQVKSFVYLSSMEVYGENHTDDLLTEDTPSKMTSLNVRNCYPQSKLICENLCVSYAHEYNLPCKIIRLAQTFGPGVPASDNRVFAQFAKSAISGSDIVLATAGTTKRCYLYTEDSATALLTVLLNGSKGETYNAANPATYCSIFEMATLVADTICNGSIKVLVNSTDNQSLSKYLPAHKWNLSADKLMALGWAPTADLEEMYRQLIKYMKAL